MLQCDITLARIVLTDTTVHHDYVCTIILNKDGTKLIIVIWTVVDG